MKLVPLAAAAAFALLASGTAYGKTIKAKYDCKGGTVLTVVFKDGKARVTATGKEPVMLPQALAADGFLYAKGKYSLRGVGNKATWTSGHHKPLTCKAR